MSVTIEPTDFGNDIIDSIRPFLRAFGLMDSNDQLDLNNWSMEKALGVFSTFERTELILDLLSGYVSQPRYVLREIISGLIVESGELPPNETREEEWYAISSGEGWSVNLIVHHQKLGPLGLGTESAHSIELGLGIHLDDMQFDLNSGNLLLNGRLGIPALRILNKGTSGNYVITDGVPEMECERLIWDQTGAPLSRIALSAELKPETGRFGSTAPSAQAIAIRSAFGQEDPNSTLANSSIVLKLALLDFIAQANSPSSKLEVDVIEAVSGGMSNVLEQIIPALIEMLPTDAQLFAENVLPMLGLIDSDWSTLNGSSGAPAWPRIEILPLVDELQNNPSQAWNRVRSWLLELTDAQVANQWLTHLSNLVFDSVSQSGIVGGSCTQSDPAHLKFLDLPGISADLLIALWEDPTGDKMLDAGLRFSANKTLGSAVDVEGGLTAWVASIPITGGGSVAFLPELVADFFIDGDGNNPLFDQTVGGGETGSPLDNLHVKIQQARLGVSIQRSGAIDPLVELLDVDIGSNPVNHYDLIDLTSGASVMDAIAGVLDTILDTISDALAENDVLQWLGSLVGLVAPRDGTFRTDWEGAGSAGDLRIDIMRMIQNPKDEITDYYARLLETDIDPYGQGNMPAWVYVQEAFVLLINTALAGPMKMDKPSMPTGQATVMGDGSPTSPWRMMIGQDGDIPGFNFFTCIEPTDTTGVNRLKFGLGCLVSLLQLRENLHLQFDIDSSLLSLNLAEVAVDDVPAEAKLLTKIACSIKLHDAIGNPGKQIFLMRGGRGFSITIDAISLGFQWVRTVGFSLRASIHAPRIGSIAPDFPNMISQLTDPSRIGELAWDGNRLFGAQDVIVPVLDDFLGASDNPPDETVLLSPVDENDSGLPLTVIWDYFGLSCAEIGYDTKEGLFGLISRDSNVNALIDLAPGEELYENEGIQMLLGQVMATKGGQWGFFLSTFFRIHPHLLHLDLVKLIMADGGVVRIPEENPYSWPIGWISYHPKGLAHLGLGPFSLPYDWPQIDWSNLVNNPYNTFKSFFINVLSGVSQSGEPFAFSVFRWLSGLLHGKVPDLTQPCLGWSMEVAENDEQLINVKIPDIPLSVKGAGTFDNPWEVQLSIENNENISFLFWLGPDGPNYSSQLDNIMTAKDQETFEALQSEIIDILQTSHLGQPNWDYTVANILIKLASYSPRVKSALGDTSVGRVAEDLRALDTFLHEGDGLSSLESQLAVFDSGINRPQTESRLSSVADSLTSPEMADDILMQISKSVPTNWSPNDGGSDSGNHLVLLISYQQQPDDWQFLLTKLNDLYTSNCIPEILTSDDDLTNFNPQSGVILFSSLAVDMDGHDSEIRSLIDSLVDQLYTLTIVAHGITGLSATSVIQGGGALLTDYCGIGESYQSNHIHTEHADDNTALIHQGSNGVSRVYTQGYPIISPNGPGPEFETLWQEFGPDGLSLFFEGRYVGQYNAYQNYNIGQSFSYIDSGGVERVFNVKRAGTGVSSPSISAQFANYNHEFSFGREYDETQIFNLITINSPHHGVGNPRYTDIFHPLRIEVEYLEKLDNYPDSQSCQVGELIKHTDEFDICRYYVVEVAGNAYSTPPTHEEGTIQLENEPDSPHLRYLYTENEFLPIYQMRIRRALHLLNSLGLSNHNNPLIEPIEFNFDVQFTKGDVIRYEDTNETRNLYQVVKSGSVLSTDGDTPQALQTTQILGQNGLELQFLFVEQEYSRTLTLEQLARLSDQVKADYSSILKGVR